MKGMDCYPFPFVAQSKSMWEFQYGVLPVILSVCRILELCGCSGNIFIMLYKDDS